MKAIRIHEFGDAHVMKLEHIDTPSVEENHVLVKIFASGVNPVDTYIRSGGYSRKPSLPYTPGFDAAGVVEAIGKDVTTCKVNDRVYLWGSLSGTYAEYALCTPSQVHPLPESVSFGQGAALGVPYATAYRALFQKAHGVAGDTVLVHGGSGGVGIAAVQLAYSVGMNVFATAGTEQGKTLLSEQGVTQILDHTKKDYLDILMDFTNNKGVDIVLEMLANVNLKRDLTILAPKGRVVIIGSRGTIDIDPRELMSRDAAIMGMVLFNADEKELKSIHAGLWAGLSNRTLRPVIGKEFQLKDAPLAHEAIMKSPAYGKIILTL